MIKVEESALLTSIKIIHARPHVSTRVKLLRSTNVCHIQPGYNLWTHI